MRVGIRRGWEGLTHLDLNDPASKAQYILPLNRENTNASFGPWKNEVGYQCPKRSAE
jgi:hypothetical protein